MFIWSVNDVHKAMLNIRTCYSTGQGTSNPIPKKENGCGLDSCKGRGDGGMYPTCCNKPCNYFYKCVRRVVVYDVCNRRNYCVMNGRCRPCGDTCEGRCDGRYQSVNRPRPYFYTCEAGQLFYQECQPFQVFNPWTKKCQCFEGSCLQGNGYRASFCRGKEWRVFCVGGFPRFYRRCPRPTPFVCCRTNVCISACNSYNRGSRCCN
ncbi:hypothetical protein LSAT2_002521 [Lamellibrachia satsuma]|nr:hypothetical protein LSAT2_002521 [Lamellibrachia satsuma]